MQQDEPDSARLAKTPALKRRSCDTCFKYKEKCTWSNRYECDRCRRVSQKCTTARPLQKMGRKPKYLIETQDTEAQSPRISRPMHPFSPMIKDLDPFENAVMGRFMDVEFFSELMTVPRMGKAMHQQGMLSVLHHWDQTRDGCFSMFGAFAAAKSIDIPGYDPERNLHRGTRALKSFRTMTCPTAPQDLLPWFWLGICVLIYAHCGLGNSGTTVRRYMLYHLLQLGEQGEKITSNPSAVSLVALDIYECLLYRQMPVMTLPASSDVGADTFLGLCAPLVRFAYQLARLNYKRAEHRVDEEVLSEFERSVEAWQPDFPPKWSEELSLVEATHVLSQSRVHKTMLLLFAHRLRSPFGQDDAVALRMSHSIFSELDLATVASGQPPMWTMTPFLVAAFELVDIQERSDAIRNIPRYGDKLSLKSQQLAAAFLEALWTRRDNDYGFRWIDIIDRLPALCVYA